MSLVYVYAVARAGCAIPPGTPRGIADAAVRVASEGALEAFVSAVPEAEFDEQPLNEHLRDLAWLTPHAVRHQEVNAALAGGCDPLAPLSFGTVFRDDRRVLDMLRERRSELELRLDAIRGKAEWIAVIRRDEAAAASALETESETLRALQAEVSGASPGHAYLLTRRLDEARRQELRSRDGSAIQDAAAALEDSGARLFREPLVEDTAAGMLARFSVLADRGGTSALDTAIASFTTRWGDRAYRLELNGPWPAYRFASVDPE